MPPPPWPLLSEDLHPRPSKFSNAFVLLPVALDDHDEEDDEELPEPCCHCQFTMLAGFILGGVGTFELTME